MLEDTRDFAENTRKEQLTLLPRTNHKSCTPHSLPKKHETLYVQHSLPRTQGTCNVPTSFLKSLCATPLVENIRKGVGHKNEHVKTHHCNAPTSFLKTPKMK
jgi:hypothetical protein